MPYFYQNIACYDTMRSRCMKFKTVIIATPSKNLKLLDIL